MPGSLFPEVIPANKLPIVVGFDGRERVSSILNRDRTPTAAPREPRPNEFDGLRQKVSWLTSGGCRVAIRIGGRRLCLTVGLLCLTVGLLCLSVDLLRLTVGLLCLTVGLLALTVGLLCLAVDLLCLTVDLLGGSVVCGLRYARLGGGWIRVRGRLWAARLRVGWLVQLTLCNLRCRRLEELVSTKCLHRGCGSLIDWGRVVRSRAGWLAASRLSRRARAKSLLGKRCGSEWICRLAVSGSGSASATLAGAIGATG